MSTEAYIGLGTNLGDRLENLKQALQALDEMPEVTLLAVSHAYESEPWGVEEQPVYVNAAVRIRTDLPADELLRRLKGIEAGMGREPGPRWGPRLIDLDILLFGDEEWASEELTIPHPRMGERDFVVRPLLEVAPERLRYPDGRPVARRGWLGRCRKDLGVVPGFEPLAPEAPPRGSVEMGPGDEGVGVCEPLEANPPGPEIPAGTGEEWVTVATTAGFGRIDRSPDIGLAFKQSVLQHESIPFAYDPHPPSEGFNPWGLGSQIKLKVPSAFYRQAMEAIAEAERARPEEPPEEE